MECNKEEADRAIQVALKKFQENDIVGAKRFALKAQKMLPEPEGIQQLIEILNVHASATKYNGDRDWYGILRVDPSSNDDIIKKAYKRMSLKVHPDKNKWAMADEAFHLVKEAYNLLSNQAWRALYDNDRKGKQSYQDPPVTGASTSTPFSSPSNDNNTSKKNAAHPTSPPTAPCPKSSPKPKRQKGSKRASSKPQAGQGTSHSRSKTASAPCSKTFWTECSHCGYKFEYERIYVNTKLICHVSECNKIYTAIEISPPRGRKKAGKEDSTSQKRQKPDKSTASEDIPTSSPAFKTPQVPPSTTETTSVRFPEATNAEHGEKEESLKEAAGDIFSCHINGKRAGADLDPGSAGNLPTKRCKNGDEVAPPPVKVPFGKEEPEGSVSHLKKSGEVSYRKAMEMQIHMAKETISKKLAEWSNTAATSSKEPREVPSSAIKDRKLKGSSNLFAGKETVVDYTNTSVDESSTTMEVPEQDFHKFSDRSKWKFEKGQVWALYDDQYGMPRLYASIENVVSLKPFKVKLCWLHFYSNEEFGPMQWIASGFHKTSGVFHRGVSDFVHDKSYFSHKMSCKRGSRGITHIYPKKGDVWAVYKNWSPNWDANVRDSPEVFNQYEVVEVLQDYSKELGVTVAPLVKVPGFKSIMRRNSDPASHVTFPKHEIFRLSHQIPYYPLMEDKHPQAPQGCIEIDLAAVPFEFAQVIPTGNATDRRTKPAEQI